ncbi:MAG: hypothetical protein EOO28_27950 [Comamonadaceae bacterium]|nr:MAG: hypothetical protein EOO28_27950 [Comamonadaceae bacterium]
MDTGEVTVLVAGGTSANKSGDWSRPLKPTDWLLQTPEVLRDAGLTNFTAIQFRGAEIDALSGLMTGGTLLTLPYNDDFFVAVAPKQTPVAGSVDIQNNAQLRASFVVAGKAAGLKQLLQREMDRSARAPDVAGILRPTGAADESV